MAASILLYEATDFIRKLSLHNHFKLLSGDFGKIIPEIEKTYYISVHLDTDPNPIVTSVFLDCYVRGRFMGSRNLSLLEPHECQSRDIGFTIAEHIVGRTPDKITSSGERLREALI